MRTILTRILALVAVVLVSACSAAPGPVASADPQELTQEELVLLSGMRLDLGGVCAPHRVDLAERALAGVECIPPSDVVDHVTVHLFNSEEDLLAAYQSRLAAHGVPMRTNAGQCLVGQPSEGAYTPEAGGGDLVSTRGGCYIDDAGHAHYAATMPPFVLLEVDGRVADSVAVQRYAWLGNQDQPGSPTIWRSAGPASPEK